jgi:hypothetical protein
MRYPRFVGFVCNVRNVQSNPACSFQVVNILDLLRVQCGSLVNSVHVGYRLKCHRVLVPSG